MIKQALFMMQWQSSLGLYVLTLGALTFVTTGIAFYTFTKLKEKPASRTFGFLMLSMAAWAFFYILELAAPTLPQKIWARKALHGGMTFAPALWLAFALRHTAAGEPLARGKRTLWLTAPSALAFLLGLTNDWHHLIWTSLQMPPGRTSFGALQLEYGIAFWGYTFLAYLFIAAGVLIHLYLFARLPYYLHKSAAATLLGALSAAGVNAYFLFARPEFHLDPTPLAFAISAPLLAFGYFRFGLLNPFPVTAPQVIENLRDAVILLDKQDRIANINRTARQIFSLSAHHIGTSIFEALPKLRAFREDWEVLNAQFKFSQSVNGKRAWHEASLARLQKRDGRLIGRALEIHDITEQQELLESEMRRSAHMSLLQNIGRRVTESLNEQEILDRAVEGVIEYFGYAEAAVSLLTDSQELELKAVTGAQEFGYLPGYRQKLGVGVIGHTAAARKTYLCQDVTQDPYYFSSGKHFGSAVGIPLINEQNLLGVLYVESAKAFAFDPQSVQTLETLAAQISAAIQRARLYAASQEHARIMSAVQTITQIVSASLNLETTSASVAQALNEFFGYAYISIYLIEDTWLRLSGAVGYPKEHLIEKIALNRGVSGRAIRERAAQFVADASADPDFIGTEIEVASEICVPLFREDDIIGVLNVEASQRNALNRKDMELLKLLAAPIALSISNAQMHEQMKRLAMTDAVTGLFNRRVFEDTLRIEIERAARHSDPLSLLIFDVDSFKQYNDAYGHPAGDERLRAIANLAKSALRNYDVAARYGGDEFAVILPNTNHKGALRFAKRLLAAAQKSAPQSAARTSAAGYTLSIGCATFPEHGTNYLALLHSADHAELIAKRAGKNQIVSANEIPEQDHDHAA